MKFCYANEICDDRGETIQVMVGIVAGAQRRLTGEGAA